MVYYGPKAILSYLIGSILKLLQLLSVGVLFLSSTNGRFDLLSRRDLNEVRDEEVQRDHEEKHGTIHKVAATVVMASDTDQDAILLEVFQHQT